MLNRMLRAAKGQRGFTIAEVVLASAIMVMTSLGMLGLFEGANQLSMTAARTKDAQRIARSVDEKIRTLPFYLPYTGTPKDFDDFYYGTRSPMSANLWSDAPEVNYAGDVDPKYQCKIKMTYINDNLSESNMITGWGNGPVPPATGVSDKPVGANNNVFHMIKYQIRVSWAARPASGTTSSYTYIGLMTDTQFQANLGVTAITNIAADSSKKGTTNNLDGQCISAPHTKSNILVKITGFGFRADKSRSAVLMKTGLDDILVTPLTRISDNELQGEVALNGGWAGGGGPPPWSPKRDPGKWSAKVIVGTSSAAAYDAFVVEFPRPIISPDASTLSPKTGKDTQADLAITANGPSILNLGTAASPYTPYAGTIIQLVKTDNPTDITTAKSGTLSYTGDGYGSGSDSITGRFDLRGKAPGEYWVQVWNCRNRLTPGGDGDTCSPQSDHLKFTLTQVSPKPNNIYVTGSANGEVFVASGEKRRFAYRNRNYTYTMRIDGEDMGGVTVAKLGVGGDPANGTGDYVVDASSVTPDPGGGFVTAVFDLNAVPDSYARADSTYNWWVYVQDGYTGAKGNVQNIFQVRKPRPILYRNAEYLGGPGGFYHNYHSVNARLTGECFDSSTYNISYNSGSFNWGSTTYTVGTSDGGMTKGSPSNNGTRWDTYLNLIHCRNSSNNIWIKTNDATPITDNGFVSNEPRTYTFYVSVTTSSGATLNAGSGTQSSTGVKITNRFLDRWLYWLSCKSATRGPTANYETASAKAKAQKSIWHATCGDQYGYVTLELRGQGFPDYEVGTMTVGLVGSNNNHSGSYCVAQVASEAAAITDRNNKFVTITTAEWRMNTTGIIGDADWDGDVNCGTTSHDGRVQARGVLQND